MTALDLLICLVERECDLTLEDDAGNLPVHFAAMNDHLDCVRSLVKQGSSIEATQSDGRTPAHVVSDVIATQSDGRTPAHVVSDVIATQQTAGRPRTW